jgi:hypothetical protein
MATMMNTPLSVKPTTILHPLASLQPDEVTRARDIVSQYNAGKDILWKIISVKEPPKAQVVTYCPHSTELIIDFSRLNTLDVQGFHLLVLFTQTFISKSRPTFTRRWSISTLDRSSCKETLGVRSTPLGPSRKWSACMTLP